MPASYRRIANILLIGGVVLAAAGCSRSDRPPLGEVTGTVTFNNQPLSGAVVIFEPEGRPPSMGMTDEQGRYELTYLHDIKGAVVGDHTVRIFTAAENDADEQIPVLYNTESTLTRSVEKNANIFDFQLESS